MVKYRRFLVLLVAAISLIVGALSVRAQYNKDYFYWVGRNNMMNSNYQGAISVLNTLLSFDNKAYEGYFLRGIAKYNLNDLIGADADLSIAIDLNPVFTSAYVNRAITRSRLGNYDDALKDFEQAIELRPDLPNPYYSRGVTRLLNRQFDLAIKDFDQFIKFESRVADAYINRGISYLHLRDTTEALTNFDTAIRTNRLNPDGYNRRGTIFMQQQKLSQAEQDFDKAIECDSSYLISYFNRAMIYNDTNRPMQAISDLDRVIGLDSTNSITYFNRAVMRTQIGDYNRALEDYNQVATYSPDNVLVYFYRANLLSRLGEVEAAVEDYTRAIELYPDFANAYLYRSELRYILRDSKGAKRDRQIADKKIAEHRSKLQDSSYSIYSDSTYRFDKLLSFDSNFSGSKFENLSSRSDGAKGDLSLKPLFRFSLESADTTDMPTTTRYYSARLDSFIDSFENDYLAMSCETSDLSPETLMKMDKEFDDQIRSSTTEKWVPLFEKAISQGLIKQYTNSVNTYSAAIESNPTNPFLYLNRSTTRAEMIDFISSIDNSYQRISIDSDPANRLMNNSSRVYNYDEALADLNKAIKLYPDFAYSYYNRANLLALSGEMPAAYDDYTHAIELYPSFGEAYYNRGIIQIFMKDSAKGCIDLSKAGELGVESAYELLEYYSQRATRE